MSCKWGIFTLMPVSVSVTVEVKTSSTHENWLVEDKTKSPKKTPPQGWPEKQKFSFPDDQKSLQSFYVQFSFAE